MAPHGRRGSSHILGCPVWWVAPLSSLLVWLEGWVRCPLAAFNRRLLNKHCPGLLPLHTALVVGCAVSSKAATLKLLLWGRALLWEVSLTSNTPWCVTSVALRKAEALTVLSLQRAFRGDISLNWDSQAAEFSQRTQFRQLWSLRYWYNKVWGLGDVLGNFVVTVPRAECFQKPASQPANQSGNQKAKWGRPSICLAILALLGSITDTLNCIWDCAYANNFPSGLKNPAWANWGALPKRQ